MWANEDLNDAKSLLLNAENIEQVTTDRSSYVVAGESTLTDELYIEALQTLVNSNELELVETRGERKIYRKRGS